MATTLAAPRQEDGGPVASPSRRWRRTSLIRDHLAGRRDGRRGLPLVRRSSDAASVEPPGHLLVIWSDAEHRIDLRFRELLTQTSADRVEHAAAGPRLETLQARIAEFQQRLAALMAAGPATGRRMGEAELPESLVLRRRANEFERKARYLRKEITESRNGLVALEVRQLELAERIDVALDAAQSDGRALATTAERRVAAYLKGAGRTHPDPSALIAAAPTLSWRPPTWLEFAGTHDLIDSLRGNDR